MVIACLHQYTNFNSCLNERFFHIYKDTRQKAVHKMIKRKSFMNKQYISLKECITVYTTFHNLMDVSVLSLTITSASHIYNIIVPPCLWYRGL